MSPVRTAPNLTRINDFCISIDGVLSFEIQTHQHTEVPRTTGGDDWVVGLHDITNQVFLPMKVVDHCNGRYSALTFLPVPGQFTLTIRLTYSGCGGMPDPWPEKARKDIGEFDGHMLPLHTISVDSSAMAAPSAEACRWSTVGPQAFGSAHSGHHRAWQAQSYH